jgi:phosphosulfolactate phosphohydrolase-like enzyme
MKGTVVIDCLPESAERYRDRYAIVVVDVIRATTVATTAVSMGRRVFPAKTTEKLAIAATLRSLVG